VLRTRPESTFDAAMSPYPVQVIWGALDPALPLPLYGTEALAAPGLPCLAASPARHFLQENQAPTVAGLIHAAEDDDTRASESSVTR
jgi:hypothetical protein